MNKPILDVAREASSISEVCAATAIGRPDPRKPIDLLGGGVVVLPPSRGTSRNYQIIHGSLDDLAALTPISRRQEIAPATKEANLASLVGIGRGNDVLFGICMKAAHHCDDLESLLDVARIENTAMIPPMDDAEVASIATKAWGYTKRGLTVSGRPALGLRPPKPIP